MRLTTFWSSLPAQPRRGWRRASLSLPALFLDLALALATTTLPALPSEQITAPVFRRDDPDSPGQVQVFEIPERLVGDTGEDLGNPGSGPLRGPTGPGLPPRTEGPADPAGPIAPLPGEPVLPPIRLDPTPWTKLDVGLATAFWVTLVTDWIQTRQIAKAQYTCSEVRQYWVGSCLNTVPAQTGMVREANPLIGARPSMQKVNLYFASTGLGSACLLRVLPAPWRRAFLLVGVSLEAYVIQDNAKVGLRIRY